jgi:hypothetical protein
MLRVRGQADRPAGLCALQAVGEHGQGLHVAARAERKEQDVGGRGVRAHWPPFSPAQPLPANGAATTSARLCRGCDGNVCRVRDTELTRWAPRGGRSYNGIETWVAKLFAHACGESVQCACRVRVAYWVGAGISRELITSTCCCLILQRRRLSASSPAMVHCLRQPHMSSGRSSHAVRTTRLHT